MPLCIVKMKSQKLLLQVKMDRQRTIMELLDFMDEDGGCIHDYTEVKIFGQLKDSRIIKKLFSGPMCSCEIQTEVQIHFFENDLNQLFIIL